VESTGRGPGDSTQTVQKSIRAPNSKRRPLNVVIGFVNVPPYAVFSLSTVMEFNRLNISSLGVNRIRPIVMDSLSRRSTRLYRGSNTVNGAYGCTSAVAVQVAAAPHAPRLRPSEGAINAFGTLHVAFTGIPGRF